MGQAKQRGERRAKAIRLKAIERGSTRPRVSPKHRLLMAAVAAQMLPPLPTAPQKEYET